MAILINLMMAIVLLGYLVGMIFIIRQLLSRRKVHHKVKDFIQEARKVSDDASASVNEAVALLHENTQALKSAISRMEELFPEPKVFYGSVEKTMENVESVPEGWLDKKASEPKPLLLFSPPLYRPPQSESWLERLEESWEGIIGWYLEGFFEKELYPYGTRMSMFSDEIADLPSQLAHRDEPSKMEKLLTRAERKSPECYQWESLPSLTK